MLLPNLSQTGPADIVPEFSGGNDLLNCNGESPVHVVFQLLCEAKLSLVRQCGSCPGTGGIGHQYESRSNRPLGRQDVGRSRRGTLAEILVETAGRYRRGTCGQEEPPDCE